MTHIEDTTGSFLLIEPDKSKSGHIYIWGPAGSYSNEQAPAIAVAVLETAGVEIRDTDEAYLDGFDLAATHPSEIDAGLRLALFHLKRALAIREYHAKPRVSDEVVAAVESSAFADAPWYAPARSEQVRRVIEAYLALDSGVLQVPADNKEGDRGE